MPAIVGSAAFIQTGTRGSRSKRHVNRVRSIRPSMSASFGWCADDAVRMLLPLPAKSACRGEYRGCTIFGRAVALSWHDQFSSGLIRVRCIHAEKRPQVRIKFSDEFQSDLTNADVVEKRNDLKSAIRDRPFDRGDAGLAVDRVQRLSDEFPALPALSRQAGDEYIPFPISRSHRSQQ